MYNIDRRIRAGRNGFSSTRDELLVDARIYLTLEPNMNTLIF